MAKARFYAVAQKDRDGKVAHYKVRFMDENGRYSHTVSLATTKTKRKAEEAAAKILAEEQQVKGLAYNPVAFDYLMDYWRSDSPLLPAKAPSFQYIKNNRQRVIHYLKDDLGDKRIYDLTKSWGNLVIRRLTQTPKEFQKSKTKVEVLSGRTVNIIRSALLVPYTRFCASYDLKNKLANIDKAEESGGFRDCLSSDEAMDMVALKNDCHPLAYAGVMLGLWTGLRAGEIRGLQWEDISFEKNRIFVRNNYVSKEEGKKLPKWKKVRYTPLCSIVVDALRDVAAFTGSTNGYVLPNQNDSKNGTKTPITLATLQRTVRKMFLAIGLTEEEIEERNLVFHGLRHHFIITCLEQELPEYVVADFVGHSTIQITEIYRKLRGEEGSHNKGKQRLRNYAAAGGMLDKAFQGEALHQAIHFDTIGAVLDNANKQQSSAAQANTGRKVS